MKRNALVMATALGLFLTGCSDSNSATNEVPQNIKQLVQDYSTHKIEVEAASITSDQLIVTDTNGDKTIYDLPEDEFFVSFAPFVERTHDWTNHSLAGCQGEMVNTEFDVLIEDEAGDIVIDQAIQSQSNGFFDLWLPRDKDYQITVSYDGKSKTEKFSTHQGDKTCITTLKLS